MSSIFAENPLRATANQIILKFATESPPLDLIAIPNENNESSEAAAEEHPLTVPGPVPTWDKFLAQVVFHPAVANALTQAAAGNIKLKIREDEIRYSVADFSSDANNANSATSPLTSGFSNRFDRKLYDSLIALVKAREDASKSRREHDKIMATRDPPTPPVEEHDENNNNNGREIQYDEDGNEIEPDEDYGNNNNNQETAAAPARPRKTRAQRKEEEKQRKEDKKRQHEVEVKEHLVSCMEQKLRYALCATAISVTVAP